MSGCSIAAGSGGRITATPPAAWIAVAYVCGAIVTTTSQEAQRACSTAAQMPISGLVTGGVAAHSRSKPRKRSKSVTAASAASSSIRARFR